MTFDDWGWPLIYFAMALAALAVSIWARSWRAGYLSVLMAISALSTDVINVAISYARAPMLEPECDAVIAVAVAGVALVTQSRLAWFVLAGFVLEGVLWVVFFLYHMQGTRAADELLNAVYATQIVGIMIGGAGVKAGLGNWLGRGVHRPFDHALGR